MGSKVNELEETLLEKEMLIEELNQKLQEKDELIEELRSQLDKYQSVLPLSSSLAVVASGGGPRKVRAQGISAEPQALLSLQEFSQHKFRKHSKSHR